jgi:hypothetical protein
MGCLSERQKGATVITCPQGWDSPASEFEVKSRIKVNTTWFNGKSVWYVRLGNPPKEGFKFPSQIARKYKINLKSINLNSECDCSTPSHSTTWLVK